MFEGPSPSEITQREAFRIFPIVHQYGMELMIGWCEKAIERNQLGLWSIEPIASSEVPNHPGLIQCLALADAKQCDSMVRSCLSKLINADPASPHQADLRRALASPNLDRLLDGLRPETNHMLIRGLVGLPVDFKVEL